MDLVWGKLGDRTVERPFIAGTADTDKGSYEYFYYEADHKPVSDHMYDSIFASSAMPGVFPPIVRDGMTLLDGGIVWKNDAVNAIQWCRDEGYADEDIIVDWIVCAINFNVPAKDIVEFHTIGLFLRNRDLGDFWSDRNDIDRTIVMYPGVNFRYVVGPSEPLTVNYLIPLDFSREHLEKCIAIGEKDARNAVEHGPQAYREAMFQSWNNHDQGLNTPIDELLRTKLVAE